MSETYLAPPQRSMMQLFSLPKIYPITEFTVFSPNKGKYTPEKTPYLDNFHAVFAKELLTIFKTFPTFQNYIIDV